MAYSARMRFFVLVYLVAAVTSLHAETPFDFASTPGKLPKQLRPTEYAIWFKPDLKKLTFSGREIVKLNVEQSTRQIILNALDLTVSAAEVDGKAVPKTAINFDGKAELLTIAAPEELAPGEHTLVLKFDGKINQFGRGLFYAKYQEQRTGANRMFLGTQFEATDARRLFPCWDEPVFRARFHLTAVVPENWMAVSNMPIASEKKMARSREAEFQLTHAMSSYLNVFCAGEFDAIESEVDGVKLRITTTKAKAESGRYALEATAQILHYYNEYFGVPYPLPKLDQLAIPGGFGGAMENWGGITYYETALLFDPANSSAATKQRVYEVIAHEVDHQWFGDLVTMAWWDNLWLNEGFASWMGTKCTARFNPQWEVWLEKGIPRDPARRIGIAKEQAMEGDARATTHPIQQKVATEAEANSAFDDITYKKGQSFLRMLESFLGEEPFRDGIRRYMQAHKYSNSTTADLWKLLLASLPGMNVPDQVNLLSDAWAFFQAGRQPFTFYTGLIDRLPPSTALAVREQIISAFNSIDHLLAGAPEQEQFRGYARRVLRPTLDTLTLQPKPGGPMTASLLRASLVQELGLLGDEEVIKMCRQNFENYLKDRSSVSADLRASTFAIAMRYGDAATWQKLHELGLKTTSTEEKQNYYDALAFASDPKLIQKSLAIALTDELPTSRAVFMVSKVARESDRPDLAWEFARKNLSALVAKVDALNANSYLPSLFTFFADRARIPQLKAFAQKNLSEPSRKPVEIASDEILFRADFRKRLIEQMHTLQ